MQNIEIKNLTITYFFVLALVPLKTGVISMDSRLPALMAK